MERETSFKCPRCGKVFRRVNDYKRHINRVFLCNPTLSMNNLEEARAKYNIKKKINFVCEKCQKGFTTKHGMKRHVEICDSTLPSFDVVKSVVSIESINSELLTKVDFLIARINDMSSILNSLHLKSLGVVPASQQIKPIEIHATPVSAGPTISPKSLQSVISSPTTPQTSPQPVPSPPPIKIKDFGQEEVLHILDDTVFMKSCFMSFEEGIVAFVKKSWFDPQHAINMNVRIIDINEIEYYQYNKWNRARWRPFMRTLLNFTGGFFQLFLERFPVFDKRFLDSYMTKIGEPLEWDLSHEGYDYDDSMSESVVEDVRESIYKYVKEKLLFAK